MPLFSSDSTKASSIADSMTHSGRELWWKEGWTAMPRGKANCVRLLADGERQRRVRSAGDMPGPPNFNSAPHTWTIWSQINSSPENRQPSSQRSMTNLAWRRDWVILDHLSLFVRIEWSTSQSRSNKIIAAIRKMGWGNCCIKLFINNTFCFVRIDYFHSNASCKVCFWITWLRNRSYSYTTLIR